ncbi:hypothetical protein BP00DRAFT_268990 [Aspergillus indologenus CBS 114.80]|uniref:Uncharacterized protein n=1 Tax=Aspergillus indologenus CBS 114.80 TaxID=1450541 RepID=A0A2V5JG35_9EURO|nr:hypothetical protein BP00DRAFT_268990 [Aspergillus indologenus CBS 114.80]
MLDVRTREKKMPWPVAAAVIPGLGLGLSLSLTLSLWSDNFLLIHNPLVSRRL